MELELRNGDYVTDGIGGLRRVGGREALLQRVLFRLTARRGALPFWEDLGSRLWQLGRLTARERPAAARQFVAEALASEPVAVREVRLRNLSGGGLAVEAWMDYQGEALAVTVEVLA